MTEPPPLIGITADIARESTQKEILALLTNLSGRVDTLMTEDAAAAAEIADIDTQTTATTTALASVQALFANLETELAAGSLSPATQAALTKAQADVDALAAAAAADVTADTPPSGA